MEKTQLAQYLGVLLLLLLAVAATGGMIFFSLLLGKRGHRNEAKDKPYECGMVPQGDAPTRFAVKFYLVAMLFILFDVAVIYLYPLAVAYREILTQPATRNLAVLAIVCFLAILSIGYLYALKKRAFDWKS